MAPSTSSRNTALTAAASIASVAGLLGSLYYLDIPSMLTQRLESRKVTKRTFDAATAPSLADFQLLCSQRTLKSTYPLARSIQKNIPIYDCGDFDLDDTAKIEQLQDELYHILTSGPGAYVLKHFFPSTAVMTAANKAYDTIIAAEKAASGERGDHFAPGSANDRIWNSFSKHALADPHSFVRYYSNPWFTVACDSYLGPGYRITTQVNVVKPGGKAQMPHRDYHLGFQTDEDVVAWPRSMHALSGHLTLQGAVAHTDMPLDSGPTRLLPFSQTFAEGFRSYRRQEFVDFFHSNYVSLPLEKGDALFFSPALFHAAGENVTRDFSRSANLIQVSSAFGKTMESIDPLPLVERTYDLLQEKYKAEGMSREVDAFIRAAVDGYPFPTNLDCRPPAPGRMAPETEQDILRRVLSEGSDRKRVMEELTAMRDGSNANSSVFRPSDVSGA